MHEFTQDTKVVDVINYKNFGGFGRLIFPTRGIDKNLTLKNLDEVLSWYSEVNPRKLSKRGYNAFALIYRPDAQLACEDLARAIAFIHEHAAELQIDTKNYSLWGGFAGAQMVAWLGSFGTENFGEKKYPRPVAVIMQYTGLSEVFGNEPPTYNCVGTHDGIANWRTMDAWIKKIRANSMPAQIEIFDGLRHGFGLGEGTVAQGWIDHAINFWIQNTGGI